MHGTIRVRHFYDMCAPMQSLSHSHTHTYTPKKNLLIMSRILGMNPSCVCDMHVLVCAKCVEYDVVLRICCRPLLASPIHRRREELKQRRAHQSTFYILSTIHDVLPWII